MKKYVCLIFIFFLLTGCSVNIVQDDSFDSMIKTVLYQDTKLNNSSFEGFSFYLPRGTIVSEKNNDNLKINYKDNNYYLYVDTIAYYYKTKKEHTIDEKIFYSTNLNYRNNDGYIDISKVDDKYFIEFMYNYAKIETYVSEDDLLLNFAVLLNEILLSSVTFVISAVVLYSILTNVSENSSNLMRKLLAFSEAEASMSPSLSL